VLSYLGVRVNVKVHPNLGWKYFSVKEEDEYKLDILEIFLSYF
jgi:hypothetical protein